MEVKNHHLLLTISYQRRSDCFEWEFWSRVPLVLSTCRMWHVLSWPKGWSQGPTPQSSAYNSTWCPEKSTPFNWIFSV